MPEPRAGVLHSGTHLLMKRALHDRKAVVQHQGLELETHAEFEETRIEDPGWILPAGAVEGEDAIRHIGVQHIGEVEVHRRPGVAKAENLGHAEIELVDVLRYSLPTRFTLMVRNPPDSGRDPRESAR